jgi:hypothetical protein
LCVVLAHVVRLIIIIRMAERKRQRRCVTKTTTTCHRSVRAFTRDPSALLGDKYAGDETFRLAAPQTYRDVRLLPSFFEDEEEAYEGAVARVEWRTGTISLFETTLDSLNNTPSVQLHDALPDAPEADAAVYVRETFAFLLRGHSLGARGCECRASVPERASTLGLGRARTGRCALECAAGWPTLEELALELAVRDVRGSVEVLRRGERAVRLPLLRVLMELAGLETVRHDNGLVARLGKSACCVPRTIRSAEEVAHGARLRSPRPYLLDARTLDPLTRAEVERDLEAMQRALRVRVLESDTDGVRAVFCNQRWHDLERPALGADLQALWRHHSPDPRAARGVAAVVARR